MPELTKKPQGLPGAEGPVVTEAELEEGKCKGPVATASGGGGWRQTEKSSTRCTSQNTDER